MLYIFKVRGLPFIKAGFTRTCVWERIATGFWSNVHPKDCCNSLAWEDLELLALYPGTEEQEAALKKALPPAAGEFWPEDQLEPIKAYLGLPLPLPERPASPPEVQRCEEKLPCCSGETISCFKCDKTFNRWHHLRQHLQSHAAIKDACGRCGLKVLKRNLKRHETSCKKAPVTA